MNKKIIGTLLAASVAVCCLSACGIAKEDTHRNNSSRVLRGEETTEAKSDTEDDAEIPTGDETTPAKEENTVPAETASTLPATETETVPFIETATTAPAEPAVDLSYKEEFRLTVEAIHNLDPEAMFDLIYVDEDRIPELVAGVPGYFVSLFAYDEGEVWPVMDQWAYGAMGNYGYDYIPGQNYIHNSNADYAGLVRYESYMKYEKRSHEIELVASIAGWYFDDANGNGFPDEGEYDDYENFVPKYFMDDVEITEEEALSYQRTGFETIVGTKTYEEIMLELN